MKTILLTTVLFSLTLSMSAEAQTEIPTNQITPVKHALTGWSSAIDGNWAVIASPQKDEGDLQSVGEVAFYHYSNGEWSIHEIVQPEGLPALSNFGIATALNGDEAFISSIGDHQNGLFSGTVFVYKQMENAWVYSEKLKGSDTGMGDRFGNALDVHNDLLVAGAYMAHGAEEKAGAVYVFESNENGWTQSAKLVAEDGKNGDYFGHNIHIINSTLIAVGAYRAGGANENSGAVYLFGKVGGDWVQVQKLVDPAGAEYDVFGYSLTSYSEESILGGTETVLLVGAPGTVSEGNQTGSIYIYRQNGVEWDLISQITHEDADLNSYFGVSMASNSIGEIFVGASRTHSQTHREAGSLFKYQLEIGSENILLNPLDTWFSSSSQSYGNYGAVVSVTDEFVVVSSPFADRDNLTNAGQVIFYSNLAVSNEEIAESIQTYELFQNYPNPFNPSTVISYQIPESSEVTLKVFDMLGREVATLVNGETKVSGKYSVTFDAGNLASGMYIYRLDAGNTVFTKKLTLIK